MYLQAVMEQATGKSLEQLAQELVFEPLEMDSSSYLVPQSMIPRLANGHINYGSFLGLLLMVLAVSFLLILLVLLIIHLNCHPHPWAFLSGRP